MAITADISLMRSDVCRAGGAMRDYEGEAERGRKIQRSHQEEIALLPPALRW